MAAAAAVIQPGLMRHGHLGQGSLHAAAAVAAAAVAAFQAPLLLHILLTPAVAQHASLQQLHLAMGQQHHLLRLAQQQMWLQQTPTQPQQQAWQWAATCSQRRLYQITAVAATAAAAADLQTCSFRLRLSSHCNRQSRFCSRLWKRRCTSSSYRPLKPQHEPWPAASASYSPSRRHFTWL